MGLVFGVYSAEPVKPFFDLGLDGCKMSTRVVTELMPFTTVHVRSVFAVKSNMVEAPLGIKRKTGRVQCLTHPFCLYMSGGGDAIL